MRIVGILFICLSLILLGILIANRELLFDNITMVHSSAYGKAGNATEVSMFNLISTPEKYDGKMIRVIGVVYIDSDGPDRGSSIYVSSDDYQYHITKNGLWIYPDYGILNTDYKELKGLNGRYVLIEGIFNKSEQGVWGLYSGAIDNVSRIDVWERQISTD